jgi:hypothetical protein
MLDAALVLVLQCDLDADCAKNKLFSNSCSVNLNGLLGQQNQS